jgi:hypothetical protein
MAPPFRGVYHRARIRATRWLLQVICPSGDLPVQSRLQKYYAFVAGRNISMSHRCPTPLLPIAATMAAEIAGPMPGAVIGF